MNFASCIHRDFESVLKGNMIQLDTLIKEGETEFKNLKETWLDQWQAKHSNLPDCIYHYTGPEGLLGILQYRAFWATNISYMNDSMEFNWGRDLAVKVLGEKIKKHSRVLRTQTEWLQAAVTQLGLTFPVHVACFCEEDDLLSQWRGYGAGVGGYSIGLDPTPIAIAAARADGGNVFLRRVIYEKSEQERLVAQLFDEAFITFDRQTRGLNLEQAAPILKAMWDSFSYLLFQYCFCFKSETFKEEKEWRIVVAPFSDYLKNNVKFRVLSNRIAPFLDINFDKAPPDGLGKLPLSSVRFGPTPHPELAEKSLRQLLEHCNYKEIRLDGSNTPLRT
jgi:hypothetical protein